MGFIKLADYFTLGNLLCGAGAIAASYQKNWLWVQFLLGAAMILDWVDGFVARLVGPSPVGKELDALADVVSFGMAPAFLLYNFLQAFTPFWQNNPLAYAMIVVPFLLPVAAAVRLARFNVENASLSYFEGLPTPAHALFWVLWIGPAAQNPAWAFQPAIWIGLCLLLAFFMLSRIPFPSLKSRKSLVYVLAPWAVAGMIAIVLPVFWVILLGLGLYALSGWLYKKSL
ncbi:MAG: CDP-alcohol phosphatidyltransferase family protein [Bacteroidia bacterium]